MEDFKIDFKEFTLENGLKAIILKRECRFFNLNFAVKVGSAYESEEEKGFSHFIEHLMFRSNLKFDNSEINKRLEFLGGDYDAFTDYGGTYFYVSGLCEDLKQGIELFSSMFRYPKFDEDEINVERDVIISEIDSCNADYEEFSYLKLNEEAFEFSHLKYDIAGTKDIIKKVSSSKLKDFYNTYYVPNNSFIVIISCYDEDYVAQLIKRFFGSWQRNDINHKEIVFEKNLNKTIVTKKQTFDVSTITYLFTFNDLTQDEKLFLKVVEYLLGGGSNSILFKRIREKEGLAYEVHTTLELSDEFKGMYIFCTTNSDKTTRVLEIINECIESMKDCNVYNHNLKLMKKLQLISIYSTIEDNEELSMFLIRKMVSNQKIDSYKEDLLKLEGMSSKDLISFCKKYFNNPTIHILRGK